MDAQPIRRLLPALIRLLRKLVRQPYPNQASQPASASHSESLPERVMTNELIRTIRHGERKLIWADAQPEQTVKTTPSASETLDRIHRLLSGHEWDSDTTAEIADTLVSAGYEILEYEPTHDYA